MKNEKRKEINVRLIETIKIQSISELWFLSFSVELPTADPSQFRSREKRQFEGLDSSNDESSDDSVTDAPGTDDSSDNTIKVNKTFIHWIIFRQFAIILT